MPTRPVKRCTIAIVVLAIVGAATSPVAAAPTITGVSESDVARSGYIEIAGTDLEIDVRLVIDGIDAVVTDRRADRVIGYVPEGASLGAVPVRIVDSTGGSNEVTVNVIQRQPAGRLRWSFRMTAPYSKIKPALGADGTLYIVDVYDHLYAVSPDGALKWAVNDAGNKGVGVGLDGTVYTTSAYVVKAFTPAGALKWTYGIDPPGFVSVALEVGPDGNVYVLASQGQGIISLSPGGDLLWIQPEEYDRPTVNYPEIVFGPNGGDTQLYFYANGRVPAVELGGGQRNCEIWHAYRSPVAVGPDGSIHQVNHAWSPDCEPLWEFDLGVNRPNDHRNGPGPAVGPDGIHYMIVNLIQFYAIRSDGSQRWHLTLDDALKAPDVDPTNAQILFGSSNTGLEPGFVSSHSTNNGREQWRYTFAPVAGFNHFVDTRARYTPDGTTAYVSTWHGTDNVYENASYFHALDVTSGGDCAVPAEVQAVGFGSDRVRLEWAPVETGADYDVVRGNLAGLRTGAEPGCSESRLSQTWWDDFEMPLAGQGYYYLVRGRNGCGAGSWGRNPDGELKQYGACH